MEIVEKSRRRRRNRTGTGTGVQGVVDLDSGARNGRERQGKAEQSRAEQVTGGRAGTVSRDISGHRT